MLRADDEREVDDVVVSGLSRAKMVECVTISRRIRQTRAVLARTSAGPRVYAASFVDSPEATFQLRRGDPMQRIALMAPSTPAVLGSLGLDADAPDRVRRLALADHLTSTDHPLTARVIVNRIWQHHFGIGIVDTPSDFGKMGTRAVASRTAGLVGQRTGSARLVDQTHSSLDPSFQNVPAV